MVFPVITDVGRRSLKGSWRQQICQIRLLPIYIVGRAYIILLVYVDSRTESFFVSQKKINIKINKEFCDDFGKIQFKVGVIVFKKYYNANEFLFVYLVFLWRQ